MSERDCPDERMAEWIESKKQHGYYVLTREELDEYLEDAKRDAYAEGRKDESDENRDAMCSRLMDVWVANHGRMPWKKAVEVVAVLKQLPVDERERLMAMEDES